MGPMRSTGIVAIAVIVLSGCATVAPAPEPDLRPLVVIDVPFDVEQAERSLLPGSNTIRGNAFMRQQGGGVVTCAGSEVVLVPATAYATARVRAVFGTSSVAQRPTRFTPDYAVYEKLTRRTRCDAQGNFVFDGVADGDFYAITMVSWVVAGRQQGGALLQRVAVEGGRVASLVIAP